MGLLDDAIREHLDLKRQRGADPGEVERLEREALGPVRREPRGRGMDAVPHLAVDVDPEHHFDPPTELLHDGGRVPEPKRGFLRRNRSVSASEPAPSDFADHLDAGLHGQPGDSHGDHIDHPDPFGQDAFDHDDPFPHDDPVVHDEPFHDAPVVHDEPATHEHAAPPLAAEPPLAEQPPPGPQLAAPPVQPEVGAEPPHLIFDSAPPPRPTFAPAPSSAPEPEPEPAADDAAELESEVEEHPAAAVEPAVPDVPAPAEPALDDHARADAARETREWSAEEAFAAEDSGQAAPAAEPDEEDVLEETPEFLQDTPDHDRLWFEQRPPRDFDFDG